MKPTIKEEIATEHLISELGGYGLPGKYQKYAEQLIDIFNKYVPQYWNK